MVECSFIIADTGIGMSKKFQETMFEPFTQENDNPQRKDFISGTGLGLSIVKRIVDIMGGDYCCGERSR
jgi:signal transduction histidine kinase